MTWHTLRLLQQTESAFLRLPAELRSLIYGFATESLKPVELFITTKNEWKSAKSATPVVSILVDTSLFNDKALSLH